jgi:type II secretory pathway pseudopilin PulG
MKTRRSQKSMSVLSRRTFAPTPFLSPKEREGNSTAAFTMIEIALCLAIIGFALVAIIGVLPIGMSVQKDNREGTVINFDANYLMDAIRSGARGDDSLTNYIVSITNITTAFTVTPGNPPVTNPVPGYPIINWYRSTTNLPTDPFYSLNGTPYNTPILTNGANIIGLLTMPKYAPYPDANTPTGFYSNYVSADFRAITGSPMDQGTSQSSRDFAFVYRVFPEVNPVTVADPSLVATAPAVSLATSLQANLNDLRLSFRWPVLPNSQLGPSFKIFRTIISGASSQVTTGPVPLTFITPLTYAPAASTNLLP